MTKPKWVTDITVGDKRVGYLYASKVPASKLPLASTVEKALPAVFQQLSLRGHDRPLTFKAEGVRWTYEPDFLSQKQGILTFSNINDADFNKQYEAYMATQKEVRS